MFNNIEGVIFDLDGTIIDSMGVWLQIDIDFLGERGIAVPENINKITEGKSFTENATHFKEMFMLKETVDEIKDEWIQMALEQYEKKIQLKDGAKDFIDKLNSQGIKVGLGTSCNVDLVEAVLRQHEITKYFDAIVTSCEVKKGKPAPDVFLRTAELMGVSPEATLVFEDTVAGVQAGKAAGMKVVAVYDQHSEADQMELKALADYYLESMVSLKQHLNETA
ncbi:HAD family hydrolase [Alkaliphilus hydrothermalis]|uniref:HAD superfamily hydrolase (TIGR01509 family) n=1 Tax=Alkaliphilus hydrothermalis TaxID=1482730 RepID=A0ABS2NND0_9FIRM|nr:HAD family phosphatase [Alkaliphilus hydrothermalis]MBM7614440.1 HAD superfamily hydrolase (TIGR01509 family) [Alkaliphilus hydrothermalis]